MKVYSNPSRADWLGLTRRPTFDNQTLASLVQGIFEAVAKDGDQALRDFSQQFDRLSLRELVVDAGEVKKVADQAPLDLRVAIDEAYDNIRRFHVRQRMATDQEIVTIAPGVTCWREARPIEKVGLYIPGGSAPLVSTVLMLGVPAQAAGCQEIVLSTPSDKSGGLNPAICYAALKIGADKLVRVGGAQAIAAMAIGTESVPKVDKIFGPGNQYVTAAKQYAVNCGVAIDMPAGPSEVMVVADEKANPAFVAADLLSQAEHGPDSQVVLATTSQRLATAVRIELDKQLVVLSRRGIAAQALKQSYIIVLTSVERALEFANLYAPEHLILNVKAARMYLPKINNAGSVFMGKYSPESAGDYASGTNHTLPTNGWARSYGGVSLDSFLKKVTFQSLTKVGLSGLQATIETLARAEGLEAHARAVSIRLAKK